MKGIKYITGYLSKGKILLTIAALFIVFSTYYQVLTPTLMGDSITSLANLSTLNSLQPAKDAQFEAVNQGLVAAGMPELTMEQFNDNILNMSDSDVDAIFQSQGIDMTAQDFKDKTGYSYQTLMTTNVSDIDHEFNDSIKKYILAVFAMGVSMYIYNFSMAFLASRSANRMKIDLFKKLHELSIRFFDSHNDGEVLSVFTNDIDNISNFITQSLVQVMAALALIIYVSYTMIRDNATLGLLVLGSGAVLAVIVVILIRKARTYVGVQQEKLGILNGYIDEQISGQKANISNGVEDEVYENFKPFNDDYTQNSIRGQIYSGMLIPVILGFMLLATALVILFGSKSVVNGTIEIGVLVAFINYTQRFFQPFTQVSAQYSVIQLGISGGERVSEVLEEVNESYVSPNPQKIDGIDGVVEFKDVNFSYDEGKPILKDLSFKVNKGQMFAVVGPTGSGKTTIMNLLNRFYDVNSGEILFDGLNINEIEKGDLRRNVGIVLQDSVLFSGTIRENIAYGNEECSEEEVINAAKLANLHDFILTLEDGYDTHIDNSTGALSTGQKQLMSIARTILTNPDLLILDEATSNVDTVTEAKIQKAMDNIIKGRTSFVIAHRLKTILNADVILVLKDGEILQQGSHEELLHEEGLYKELYTNQFVFE